MVLDPWADMVGMPMGREFFEACGRIDPEADARHRQVVLDCVAKILGDRENAEVFVLALDGLLSDDPTIGVLERRMQALSRHFTQRLNTKKKPK